MLILPLDGLQREKAARVVGAAGDADGKVRLNQARSDAVDANVERGAW